MKDKPPKNEKVENLEIKPKKIDMHNIWEQDLTQNEKVAKPHDLIIPDYFTEEVKIINKIQYTFIAISQY